MDSYDTPPTPPPTVSNRVSVREMQHQSRIATQKAMLELGKLQAATTNIETEHETGSDDESSYSDQLPEPFDMRQYFREYCDINTSEDSKRLKVFYLLHQNSLHELREKKLEKEIESLREELNDQKESAEFQEDESERYIRELDEKDLEISQLKKRIVKLRENCMAKNKKLFWMANSLAAYTVGTLAYIAYQYFGPDFDLSAFKF